MHLSLFFLAAGHWLRRTDYPTNTGWCKLPFLCLCICTFCGIPPVILPFIYPLLCWFPLSFRTHQRCSLCKLWESRAKETDYCWGYATLKVPKGSVPKLANIFVCRRLEDHFSPPLGFFLASVSSHKMWAEGASKKIAEKYLGTENLRCTTNGLRKR